MLPARCLERKLSRAWEQGARSFAECAVCVLCGDAAPASIQASSLSDPDEFHKKSIASDADRTTRAT